MKDNWDLGFLCCSGGHEKKKNTLAGDHGGMNADHADCSTSYSSWF